MRAGDDGAEDQGWPENTATEKLRDVDRGEPDEPGRVLGVFVGSDGGVSVGGDGDQYVVGRDCGDSGVCVFQGAVVEGAGAGSYAGANRGNNFTFLIRSWLKASALLQSDVFI